MRSKEGVGTQLGRFPVVEGYEIEGYLGEGGMGTVYRARRALTGLLVAVKILKAGDPSGIYQIKREFRILADIVHPNLVRLFELNCGAEHWFFTMELVSGRPLLDYLSVQRIALPTAHGSFAAGPNAPTEPSSGGRLRAYAEPQRQPLDAGAVRACLVQLAEAVGAIHRAHKLHCDIKPSNILVETGGRVVVLDFGVSVSVEHSLQHTIQGEIGGTPEYMSPEQAAGKSIGTASDWYSVGVVLYEVLCGQLPLSGMWSELRQRKQSEVPLPPSSRLDGIPADLEALCMALLQPDPAKRPDGTQVLAALRAHAEVTALPPKNNAVVETEGREILGRDTEVAVLHQSFSAVSPASPVVVLITGDSGIGKSALVQRFLDELARDSGAIALCGRCYERESVPYNCFDPLIDEVSRFLRRLTDREVADLLPRDISALSRIFPVLQRVPAIALSRGRLTRAGDLVEVRQRAAAALKELLARLADSWRFIVTIDDAQWGDEDSARLLIEILTPPDAPALLVILSSRPDEQRPILRELLNGQSAQMLSGAVRHLRLKELPALDAQALAESVLGDAHQHLAPFVAQEARGNPFFVRELSLYAARHASLRFHEADPPSSVPLIGVPPSSVSARLGSMLRERIAALTAAHRRALHLIAVAARPMPSAFVSQVIEHEHIDIHVIWQDLRAVHLVRMVGTTDNWSVECYHDRVRETVLADLSADARTECHRILAGALEKSSLSEPEALLEHYLGAGDEERAREHVLVSAAAAVETLAFARAARLYRLAHALLSEQAFQALGLGPKLAYVLASDGRLEEAAVVYEQCAVQASAIHARALQANTRQASTLPTSASQAIEFQRLAAQHYLTSGNGQAGEQALRRVLADVGLKYPSTPGAAVALLAWERLKLRVRGLDFTEKEPNQLDLARTDVCFSAAVGLAMTDLLRAAAFSVQHLNLAIKAGEPERVARGLTFEMGVAPGAGEEGLRWASNALPTAERLSERHGNAYHRGLFFLAQAHVAYLNGQWKAAVGWVTRAEAMLTESHVPDLHWAILSGKVLSLISSVVAGDLLTAARQLPRLLTEARQRGEAHRLALMAYPAVVLELAHGRPDSATSLLHDLERELKSQAFGLREFTLLHCSWLVDRYCGRESDTWSRLELKWRDIEASKVLVVNIVRITALAERGSAALAYAAAHKSSAHCRIANKCAGQLAKERLPHASALSSLLRARLERLQGNPAKALSLLNESSFRLDAAGLALHAHCVRRVSARLMAGSIGALLVAEADQALRDQGVADPTRFASMMVPGFEDLVHDATLQRP